MTNRSASAAPYARRATSVAPGIQLVTRAIWLGLACLLSAVALIGCSGGSDRASSTQNATITPSLIASPSPADTPAVSAPAAARTAPNPTPGFGKTGGMGHGRSNHTATLLLDGRVLIAGGNYGYLVNRTALDTAELYDPATGEFSNTGSMTQARTGHTATLLPDGRVLIAGGEGNGDPVATAEIYDPGLGTFSPTGSMSHARTQHTATMLPDGSVLMAGGDDNMVRALASAELYEPQTGKFKPTGSMVQARGVHTATLLPGGRVLLAGGWVGGDPVQSIATAEVYDPISGKFAKTGSMAHARFGFTATALADGQVLVAGGGFDSTFVALDSAELYNPATGKFGPTGNMSQVRSVQTATLLGDGRVLVAGGYDANWGGYSFNSVDIYDPVTQLFTPTASMDQRRASQTATLLPDGRVIIAGGNAYCGADFCQADDQAELFRP
jgi:WD40 repeat protein